MDKMESGAQDKRVKEEETVQGLPLKDKLKKWWSKNKQWILPVGGVLGAVALAVIFGSKAPDDSAQTQDEPENPKPDEKSSEPTFDPELFQRFPPSESGDRLPQSVLANSVGMSSRQFGLEARKKGLLDEDGRRTPAGEEYGDVKYNKNGYPYVSWDPIVAKMIGDPDEWAEFVRLNREIAGLDE